MSERTDKWFYARGVRTEQAALAELTEPVDT